MSEIWESQEPTVSQILEGPVTEQSDKWVVVRVYADGTRQDHEEFDNEDEACEWAEVYDENLRLEPFMAYEVEKRAKEGA